MEKVNRYHKGFTLIEMVVVMLILSALAVTAYARMSQIDTQSRQVALKSLKDTILSAATMAKGVCMADPQCDNTQQMAATVIEGHTIYFNHGYPAGWLGNANGDGSLFQLIDPGKFTVLAAQSDASHAIYYLEGAKDTSHCKLDYVISSSASQPGELSVTVDGSGC